MLSCEMCELLELMSIKDSLLSQVFTLWILTMLLVDNTGRWQIYKRASVTEEELATSMPNSEGLTAINQINDRESFSAIQVELHAIIEKVASAKSKKILAELERRLLQKAQCQGFGNFILGVILMNCSERMCWLFQTWESNQHSFQVSA